MPPLPEQVPQSHQTSPLVVSAYDICLKLERSLQQDVMDGKEIGRNLVYVRILGYFIHYAPTIRGLNAVVQEILSGADDSAILEIGEMYYAYYIRAFRSNKSPIRTPPSNASRRSFNTITDMVDADSLVEAPQSHVDAKKQALFRDDYRCVVTGFYDRTSVMEVQQLQTRFDVDPNATLAGTQCAHIFSESTNASIEPGSDKRDGASMRAVMQRFGHEELTDELNGSKVHCLENVMTTVVDFQLAFDRLDIWFVPTGVENEYQLEATNHRIIRRYPQHVTFTTPDQEKFPVPSPVYLAIHAACARVTHLSGAGECIDNFHRDMDDSTILDPKGASAETLGQAIFASGFVTTV